MNGMANKKNYFQTFLTRVLLDHLDKEVIINLEADLEEGAEVEAEVEAGEEAEVENSFRVIPTLVMFLRIRDINIKIITTKRTLM
jgi:hypothetical protein